MKTFISNTHGEKIAVEIDTPIAEIKGIAFVAHGLGGNKSQSHILAFSQALNGEGFLTVRWDARHTPGESEGELEDGTLTSYVEDFETVVDWASTQDWYKEPFVVCGHSLGAACALQFAIAHPKKVKAIIAASAFVSGIDFVPTVPPDVLSQWEQTGIREWMSSTQPGLLKRLKWAFVEDANKYNLLDTVQNLTQPVLVIVGSDDQDTPVALQKRLFVAVSSPQKELHIIEGAPHTFKDTSHLHQISEIVKNWLRKVA